MVKLVMTRQKTIKIAEKNAVGRKKAMTTFL